MRPAALATFALLAACAAGLARAAPERPQLGFPVACEIGRTCEVQNYVDRDPGPGVRDYRCGRRTYEKHSGLDIRLPDMRAQQRGVAVLTAAAGKVSRLRDGVADVSVRATGAGAVDGRECGNGVVIDHGGGWETQYCHMARGSIRVKQGDVVAAGQPIGRIGLSGQTEYPHLHLTVRQGTRTVDPFAPEPGSAGACAARQAMWTPAAAAQLAYKSGAILNAGFAGERVSMGGIEAGNLVPATSAAPVLIAFMRVIAVEKGDQLEMVLTAPSGAVLAQAKSPPLDSDKAQQFQMIGRNRPAAGWPPGIYAANLRVLRGGKAVLQRRVTARL